MSRSAFIFDSTDVVAERLGGRALDNDEISVLSGADFDEQLITELKFFHALLGNWDYELPLSGEGLWNTDVIELESGERTPVAGDFDLSSFVTGEVLVTAPRDYHPDLEDIDRQVTYQLEQIEKHVPSETFLVGANHFLAHRNALQSLIGAAEIDEAGRANAERHLQAFFEALEKTADLKVGR